MVDPGRPRASARRMRRRRGSLQSHRGSGRADSRLSAARVGASKRVQHACVLQQPCRPSGTCPCCIGTWTLCSSCLHRTARCRSRWHPRLRRHLGRRRLRIGGILQCTRRAGKAWSKERRLQASKSTAPPALGPAEGLCLPVAHSQLPLVPHARFAPHCGVSQHFWPRVRAASFTHFPPQKWRPARAGVDAEKEGSRDQRERDCSGTSILHVAGGAAVSTERTRDTDAASTTQSQGQGLQASEGDEGKQVEEPS